jgi:hypothetical protein
MNHNVYSVSFCTGISDDVANAHRNDRYSKGILKVSHDRV